MTNDVAIRASGIQGAAGEDLLTFDVNFNSNEVVLPFSVDYTPPEEPKDVVVFS